MFPLIRGQQKVKSWKREDYSILKYTTCDLSLLLPASSVETFKVYFNYPKHPTRILIERLEKAFGSVVKTTACLIRVPIARSDSTSDLA